MRYSLHRAEDETSAGGSMLYRTAATAMILLVATGVALAATSQAGDAADPGQTAARIAGLEQYVVLDSYTQLPTLDEGAARVEGVDEELIALTQEVLRLQNHAADQDKAASKPRLSRALTLAVAASQEISKSFSESELRWLVSNMRQSPFLRAEDLLEPVDALQLFDVLEARGLTFVQATNLIERFTSNSPDFNDPEAAFALIQTDFPGLADTEVSEHLGGILELYRRRLRLQLINVLDNDRWQELVPESLSKEYCVGIDGFFTKCTTCRDEMVMAALYPVEAVSVSKAATESFEYGKIRFGDSTKDTRDDAFRHPVWNALSAKYISVDPETSETLAAIIAEGFTTAHEECLLDTEERASSLMDLHNNGEGLAYFRSVAREVQECWPFWPFCYTYTDTPEVEEILDYLHHNALGATCEPDTDKENLDDLYPGEVIYSHAIDSNQSIYKQKCDNLTSSTLRNGYDKVLFGYEPGNTYAKPSRSVYFSWTPYRSVRFRGFGHNQDSVGYARVMRIEVNGTVYTPITWLSHEETEEFSFYVPASAFNRGYNTIKAYVHWSNSSYDNGHWTTVIMTP